MDDVLLNKVAIIERSLNRINEEFVGSEEELKTNFTKQDSITLNLLRACESSIDAAMHIVRVKKLGVPQSIRHAFELLEQAGLIELAATEKMKAMVGFRNIAVHDYQKLSIDIMEMIIAHHLSDFTEYTKVLLNIASKKS
jgi:uncharacterized protein YutE (UPF0331/DUF86 family)